MRYRRVYDMKIAIFVIIIFTITIGYSFLVSNLNINGSASVSNAAWDVHLENLKVTLGSVNAISPATLTDDKKNVNFSVMLQQPGEFYRFSVDVVNSGTLDASLLAFTKTPDLSPTQQQYMSYTVTYLNGAEPQKNDRLKSGERLKLIFLVKFKDNITADQLPADTKQQIDYSFNMQYIMDNKGKANEVVIPKNVDLSGNGNNPVFVGATLNSDGTATIDGSSGNYINCGLANYNFGNTMTFIVRFKILRLFGVTHGIVGNWQDGGFGLEFSVENGLESALFTNSIYNRINEATINYSTLHTAAVTYNGNIGEYKLFVDGVLVNSQNITGSIVPSSMPLVIGGDLESFGLFNPSHSMVDYFLVYDRTLSDAEVAEYGAKLNYVNQDDLLLWYDF